MLVPAINDGDVIFTYYDLDPMIQILESHARTLRKLIPKADKADKPLFRSQLDCVNNNVKRLITARDIAGRYGHWPISEEEMKRQNARSKFWETVLSEERKTAKR